MILSMITGFIIWMIVSVLFLGFGILAFRAKKPVGFWANAETPEVDNVSAYNKAVGKMWCIFAVAFAFMGFPFVIAEQNSPLFFVSIVGVMLEIIVVAVFYSLKIEAKYRKK